MIMDTTTNVYFDVKNKYKSNTGVLYFYMYDRNGTTCIDSMAVAYPTGDEKNIERMKEKAKMEGFMFFAESEEGRRWVEENKAALAEAWWNTIRGTFNNGWGDVH